MAREIILATVAFRAVPLPNKEAERVAKPFMEHFTIKYGVPKKSLHTRQGSEFLAQVLKATYKLLQVKQ